MEDPRALDLAEPAGPRRPRAGPAPARGRNAHGDRARILVGSLEGRHGPRAGQRWSAHGGGTDADRPGAGRRAGASAPGRAQPRRPGVRGSLRAPHRRLHRRRPPGLGAARSGLDGRDRQRRPRGRGCHAGGRAGDGTALAAGRPSRAGPNSRRRERPRGLYRPAPGPAPRWSTADRDQRGQGGAGCHRRRRVSCHRRRRPHPA